MIKEEMDNNKVQNDQYINNLSNIISNIKDKNIKVIGTSLDTSKSLETLEKMDNFAIIFGNEGNGVSEDILSLCDEVIKINMSNKCESLNVSVSSGIILYNLWSKNE